MQTSTFVFSPMNPYQAVQFAEVHFVGTFYEADAAAQKLANETGGEVQADLVEADGSKWTDARIGVFGVVSPCKH